jgi:hypothetical protein
MRTLFRTGHESLLSFACLPATFRDVPAVFSIREGMITPLFVAAPRNCPPRRVALIPNDCALGNLYRDKCEG